MTRRIALTAELRAEEGNISRRLADAEALMSCGREQGIPITFLLDSRFFDSPLRGETASALARFQPAVATGHGVELLFQPEQNDLAGGFSRSREGLTRLLSGVDPDYRLSCVRIGRRDAIPYARLYDILVDGGVVADCTVIPGMIDQGRGLDFRFAYSSQPYFPNRRDFQLKAPPSEHRLIELPAGSPDALTIPVEWGSASTAGPRRTFLHPLVSRLYFRSRPIRPWVNRVLPRDIAHGFYEYPPEPPLPTRYDVIDLPLSSGVDREAKEALRRALQAARDAGATFVRLQQLANDARDALESRRRTDAAAEAATQVEISHDAILGKERNERQSYRLQAMIPPGARTLLDLGCGSGYWSHRIALLHPEMQVTGVDAGAEFIAAGCKLFGGDRVRLQVEDFGSMTLPDASFDCVYADNSLEHSFDVDRTLGEVIRVLRPGGTLVAAFPCDAYNPARACPGHNWKTFPGEVRERLHGAGFESIEVEEVDTYRDLGMAPFPPSNDRMMYIRARRPAGHGAA